MASPLWGTLSPQVTNEGATIGHFPLIRRVPRHLPPKGKAFAFHHKNNPPPFGGGLCFYASAQKFRQGFAVFQPLVILGGGGKFHVTGGVQRRFHGILNHTDDKPNADHLHGNVIGNAK